MTLLRGTPHKIFRWNGVFGREQNCLYLHPGYTWYVLTLPGQASWPPTTRLPEGRADPHCLFGSIYHIWSQWWWSDNYDGLSSSFCTMPFKFPSMPFQIAFLYDIILKVIPFQITFPMNVKLFERALGWACHSILYNTKGQFDIEKGHLKKGKVWKKNILI